MNLKEWVEEHLLTAKRDKLSGKRINEKWMRDRGYDKEYEELISINPNFNLACKIVVGWTGICTECPNIVVLPRKCCSYKCSVNSSEWKDKKRKTMVERYGVENAFAKGKLRNEFEEKNLGCYGVRFPITSKEVREKAKETCRKNYGVDYYFQSDVSIEHIKNSLIEKYGVDNAAHIPGTRDKIETTNLEKYGFRIASQNPEVQQRIKESNLKKYGVDNPAKTEWFKDKKKKTCLKMYGVEFANQSHYTEELLEAIENGFRDITGASDPIFDCVCLRTKYTLIHQYRPDLVKELSMGEKEIVKYIKSICDYEIFENKRKFLGGWEIDVYLPELKLGFEFNGTYWHSTKFKSKNYHQKKSICAKEKDITLVHLYEFDGLKKNKEIINKYISGTEKIETITKENFIYSNLDQGSNKTLLDKFVGYKLNTPVYDNSGLVVFGAGYEIFEL